MKKTIFSTEDIHSLRVELAERREHMAPEDAQRDYNERVASGKRRIEELRKDKANIPMRNAR